MGMAWRKRGIGSFIGYTDKWTALSEPTSGSLLDANGSITLGSLHHDQANQIRQHSSRRPKSRLGFLHGETWVHDHHRSTLRREAALIELRIPKAETRVVLFTAEGDEKRIGSFMNISYTCDDIDKTYEQLKHRVVEYEGPTQQQP